jgi:hypothetical protein
MEPEAETKKTENMKNSHIPHSFETGIQNYSAPLRNINVGYSPRPSGGAEAEALLG